MGGPGSGNWYRWNKKGNVEDHQKLSIKRLCEKGVIINNGYSSGSWQWLRNDEVVSSIKYESNTSFDNSYFRVKYKNTQTEESFDYKIKLTTTTPNYGGKRFWFTCPIDGCGRRVANLYMGDKYFACRHCYDLAYRSQSEPQPFRFLHKAQKIHQELGGDGVVDWLPKPKHMHWKTFNKKYDEMMYYENLSCALAARKFGLIDF